MAKSYSFVLDSEDATRFDAKVAETGKEKKDILEAIIKKYILGEVQL